MAMMVCLTTRQLVWAPFTHPLEWENQPAARRLVAGPAGTSRTIVAAHGTFAQTCAVVSRVFRVPSRDSTVKKSFARKNLASGGIFEESIAMPRDYRNSNVGS
jgi:hypothetical protein